MTPKTTKQTLASAMTEGESNSSEQSSSPSSKSPSTPSASPSPSASGGGAAVYGAIGGVNVTTGLVDGWAYDPDVPSQPVTVEFYLDGPAGTGTLLASMVANQNRTYVPSGNIGFKYTFAPSYADGKLRSLYIYGIDPVNGQRNLLIGTPLSFWIGTNTAGLNYYNANVKSALISSCNSCHNLFGDYLTDKYSLANPEVVDGGSATNNTLFNKARGMQHPGGVRCAADASPCNLISSWWGMEFN